LPAFDGNTLQDADDRLLSEEERVDKGHQSFFMTLVFEDDSGLPPLEVGRLLSLLMAAKSRPRCGFDGSYKALRQSQGIYKQLRERVRSNEELVQAVNDYVRLKRLDRSGHAWSDQTAWTWCIRSCGKRCRPAWTLKSCGRPVSMSRNT